MAVEGDGEWSLYWTSRGRPVPARLAPVLTAWADLDKREDAADIGPGHPILIDPEYRLDPVLARFLGRSRFAWLAEGTRQAYAKDYRLWRDTGLLGYDAAGQPDSSWRGRNDGRNAAFTDLLFSSGLRLREYGDLAGCPLEALKPAGIRRGRPDQGAGR